MSSPFAFPNKPPHRRTRKNNANDAKTTTPTRNRDLQTSLFWVLKLFDLVVFFTCGATACPPNTIHTTRTATLKNTSSGSPTPCHTSSPPSHRRTIRRVVCQQCWRVGLRARPTPCSRCGNGIFVVASAVAQIYTFWGRPLHTRTPRAAQN